MITFHHVQQLLLVSETNLMSLTHAGPNSTICSALMHGLGTIRFEATVGHCMFFAVLIRSACQRSVGSTLLTVPLRATLQ